MYIIVFSIVKAHYQKMEIPIKHAYRLIQDCENSFDRLVSLIYFKYGKIKLRHPTGKRSGARSRQSHSVQTHDEDQSEAEYNDSEINQNNISAQDNPLHENRLVEIRKSEDKRGRSKPADRGRQFSSLDQQ